MSDFIPYTSERERSEGRVGETGGLIEGENGSECRIEGKCREGRMGREGDTQRRRREGQRKREIDREIKRDGEGM